MESKLGSGTRPGDPTTKKIIFVLEEAYLKTARLQKKTVLLNSNEHKKFIATRLQEDYKHYRPDVVHRSMMAILDSPLNKAGLVQVYLKTKDGLLIEIDPGIKIPRTEHRFFMLMAQLIENLKIRAVNTSKTLLKIIKNPVSQYLPKDCLIIGTSSKAKLVKLNEFIPKIAQNNHICFVVGAVAHGNPGMENDYVEDCICISKYSLSASMCLNRICNALEVELDIH